MIELILVVAIGGLTTILVIGWIFLITEILNNVLD